MYFSFRMKLSVPPMCRKRVSDSGCGGVFWQWSLLLFWLHLLGFVCSSLCTFVSVKVSLLSVLLLIWSFTLILQPLDTAASRMQTSAFGKSKGFWKTLSEGTWSEAFDGLGISIILTSNPAIQVECSIICFNVVCLWCLKYAHLIHACIILLYLPIPHYVSTNDNMMITNYVQGH